MADLPIYLVLAAVVFVGFAIVLVDPLFIAIVALPGVLLIHRVGGASLNISVCDVLTVAGTAVALPMLRSDMRATRRLLWIDVVFQTVLLLTVIVHPNHKDVFEWWHRFFLVGGSIAIGAAIGRARVASEAVTAFLVATSFLAIATIEWSLTHGLAPAYPLGLQKNFVGAMTAGAVLIAVIRPPWLKLRASQCVWLTALCATGLLASQSRGAMLGLAAGLLVAALRQGRISRRGVLAVLVATPLVLFASVSLWHESDQHVQFNSLKYRADYSALAYREWHMSPVFGQGMRFFEEPGALLQTDAHSVIASTLAEGGIVGLAALAVLIGLVLLALWRLPPDIGALALAFVVGRFVHGLFDVYWVAGAATLPWLIVGIVCGTHDADAADDMRSITLSEMPAAVRVTRAKDSLPRQAVRAARR